MVIKLKSLPTRGRTLDHAAFVYDTLESILPLAKQAAYDRHLLSLLDLTTSDRVLDLGEDTHANKHNYMVSLIHHGVDPAESAQLSRAMLAHGNADPAGTCIRCYPNALRQAWETSHRQRFADTIFTLGSEAGGARHPLS